MRTSLNNFQRRFRRLLLRNGQPWWNVGKMIPQSKILTRRNSPVRNDCFGPYVDLRKVLEITLQDVRLELLKDEAAERGAKGAPPPHKVSLTGFMTTGFEIEDRQ